MPVPDIFISYAHIDNEPMGIRQGRWVSEFSAHLSAKLAQVTGRPVTFWRDPSLPGSAIINEEIHQQLENAEVMVAVLSPRYVHSESCRDEVRWFEQAATLRRGTRNRIVKVVKTP